MMIHDSCQMLYNFIFKIRMWKDLQYMNDIKGDSGCLEITLPKRPSTTSFLQVYSNSIIIFHHFCDIAILKTCIQYRYEI